MAVFCEFISVIIRKDSIEKYYPGGWNNFAMSGGRHLCCDGEIVRIGSMSPQDAYLDIQNLKSNGLQYNQSLDNSTSIRKIDDVVILDQFVGHDESRDWLEFGDTVFNGKKYFSCWLKGSRIETLAFPLGYLNRMSGKKQIILGRPHCTPEEFANRYTFVRVENDYDIYLDSETGFEFFMPIRMTIGEFFQLDEERSKQIEASDLVQKKKKEREEVEEEAKAKEAARKKRREEIRISDQKKAQERQKARDKRRKDWYYEKVAKTLNRDSVDQDDPFKVLEDLAEHAFKSQDQKDLDVIDEFWQFNYGLGLFSPMENGDGFYSILDPEEIIRQMKFEWDNCVGDDEADYSEEDKFNIFKGMVEWEFENDDSCEVVKPVGKYVLTACLSDFRDRKPLSYFEVWKDLKEVDDSYMNSELFVSDDDGKCNYDDKKMRAYFDEHYLKPNLLDDLVKALQSKEGIESVAESFNRSDLLQENMETDTMFSRDIADVSVSIDCGHGHSLREVIEKGYEGFKDSFLPEDEDYGIIVKRHFSFVVTADWNPFQLCTNFRLFNYESDMYEQYKKEGVILYGYDKQHPPLNYTEDELEGLFNKEYLTFRGASFHKERKSVGFSIDDIELEDYSGKVGQLLSEYLGNPLNTMKKEKREILDRLLKECESQSYIFFGSASEHYFIGKVGESYIYDVPDKKAGHLRQFRNQKIRVICVGSGTHFHRQYAAGVYKS